MTVMLVDDNQCAMQKVASILTSRQIAITVVLRQTIADTIDYTMSHAVDKIFVQKSLVGKQCNEFIDAIHALQPITSVFLLDEDDEIGISPQGDIVKKKAVKHSAIYQCNTITNTCKGGS